MEEENQIKQKMQRPIAGVDGNVWVGSEYIKPRLINRTLPVKNKLLQRKQPVAVVINVMVTATWLFRLHKEVIGLWRVAIHSVESYRELDQSCIPRKKRERSSLLIFFVFSSNAFAIVIPLVFVYQWLDQQISVLSCVRLIVACTIRNWTERLGE